MSGSALQNAVSVDTPTRILDVAERLFGQNGLDNVSMREIVRGSGQANLSAVNYHFGSREALIGALLARRIHTINELRHQRLDELEASGRDAGVHAIVAATVGAVAETVRTTQWGSDYIRVIAQAMFLHQKDVWKTLDRQTLSGQDRAAAMLKKVLPQLPPAVFRDRVWSLNNQAIYTIARWSWAHGPVTPSNSRRFAALIRNTIDFLAAGMAAPIGEPGSLAAIEAGDSS